MSLSWNGWLCLHLDAHGRPCRRGTTKPLSMCSEHRPAPVQPKRQQGSRAEYQRNRRASLRNAGVMEGV